MPFFVLGVFFCLFLLMRKSMWKNSLGSSTNVLFGVVLRLHFVSFCDIVTYQNLVFRLDGTLTFADWGGSWAFFFVVHLWSLSYFVFFIFVCDFGYVLETQMVPWRWLDFVRSAPTAPLACLGSFFLVFWLLRGANRAPRWAESSQKGAKMGLRGAKIIQKSSQKVATLKRTNSASPHSCLCYLPAGRTARSVWITSLNIFYRFPAISETSWNW